ncbi:hypothetical protein BDW02DRAFT_566925 [Decorospora gaudefroyi]|uniref:Uncharacterized protein n=1 Tax=Decorospora gaudefroyi TaxID=184978 RepID=A0A6A5KEB9_9PLEO|nr:hypothetical protein BDW02DRAFT_566925 [Decorospora gaudefroyi]
MDDAPYGREVRLSHKPKATTANASCADTYGERQYLGLTQVNWRIRKEFWPNYSLSYRPYISFEELPEFLATYPLGDAPIARTLIQLVQGLRASSQQSLEMDITPLLTVDWSKHPFDVRWVVSAHNRPSEVRLVLVADLLFKILDPRRSGLDTTSPAFLKRLCISSSNGPSLDMSIAMELVAAVHKDHGGAPNKVLDHFVPKMLLAWRTSRVNVRVFCKLGCCKYIVPASGGDRTMDEARWFVRAIFSEPKAS